MEGKTRRSNLPGIHPEAFQVVADWMYKRGFSIKERLSIEKFRDAYKATVFLGVDSLKRAMMSAVAESLQEDIQKKSVDKMIERPMSLIRSITEVAPVSDWQNLRQATDKVIPHQKISASSLRDIAEAEPSENNILFMALLIDSYQEFLSSVFCAPCLKQVKNTAEKCYSCRKPFNFQKREGPPQKSEKSA
ncbi:hypothetical protein TWF281_009024 [Arthrobotrys megalospora]